MDIITSTETQSNKSTAIQKVRMKTVDYLTKNNITWSDYQQWLWSLKHLTNKIDFLDIENSFVITQGLMNIIDSIENDGYPYTIDRYGYYMRIKLPNGRSRQVFFFDYGINKSTSLQRCFDDKVICWKILESEGISTPKSFLLIKADSNFSDKKNNIESAIRFANNVWYPLIIKPTNWYEWRGVKKVINQQHLIDEIDLFNNGYWEGDKLMIQEFVEWKDIRVIFLNWKIELAFQRVHAFVIWDWVKKLSNLINSENLNANKEMILHYLIWDWKSLDYIPKKDEIVQYVPTANLSTWWTAINFDFDDNDVEFMAGMASKLWARYFGADILTKWKISEWTVLEINEMPWTNDITKPWFGKAFGEKIRKIIKEDEGI